ncbi:MAG TPA: MafI family immunity protein, partial [Pyrinomonadaceae bacterium]|nr:MafI family immunity protein [Pyrinomonadaceae bacterium]
MSAILSRIEKILSPQKYRLRVGLIHLTERARSFGLSENDVANAIEAIDHNEGGLALDIILVQLYEYSIPVDKEFVDFAEELSSSVGINWDKYGFIH